MFIHFSYVLYLNVNSFIFIIRSYWLLLFAGPYQPSLINLNLLALSEVIRPKRVKGKKLHLHRSICWRYVEFVFTMVSLITWWIIHRFPLWERKNIENIISQQKYKCSGTKSLVAACPARSGDIDEEGDFWLIGFKTDKSLGNFSLYWNLILDQNLIF